MRNIFTFGLVLVFAAIAHNGAPAQSSESDMRQLGVGMWTWQLEKCGSPEEIAAKAKSYGIKRIYLKVHDGVKPYGRKSRIIATAKACKKSGLIVWVWGFNHANHPREEAALIKGWLAEDYIDGYVYNTESPLKSKAKWRETEDMVKDVWDYRARNFPEKFLGFAPYAFPSKHSTLPYLVLVKYTDFIEPQMYHYTMRRSVKNVVNTTYHEWLNWQEANGIKKPILPLGQTYGGVPKGDILEFGKRTRGYYAVSFWDWQHTPPYAWSEVQAVAEGRNSWPDTSEKAEPLPPNPNQPLWVARWWNYWWLVRWEVSTFLLLILLSISTFFPNVRLKRWWVVGICLVIIFWPLVLALLLACMAVGSVAAIVLLIIRSLAKR